MTSAPHSSPARVLAICGGVGGAKLALGLYRILPPNELAVIVNTGDDFEHLGLHISPDIDTVLYTLAGLSDPERGWGRASESWAFMGALREFGAEDWFQLGDRDLALHVLRTSRLAKGETLTKITASVARHLGVAAQIRPMSDDPVRTLVATVEGDLPFQRYFVEKRCSPRICRLEFVGASEARPAPFLIDYLRSPDLRAIAICPSNPYLSIDPILAVPGIREALAARAAPAVAVSPLIGGRAVKGPTAKIMAELGLDTSNLSIASHYDGLLDGLIIDDADRADAEVLTKSFPNLSIRAAPTLMTSLEERDALARQVLDFADGLTASGRCDARLQA